MGKDVISTSTSVNKQVQTNPDGTTVTTITTTTVEKLSDGSQRTKTQVETQKQQSGSEAAAGNSTGQKMIESKATAKQSQASNKPGVVKNTTDEKFLQEALKAHNDFRAKHSSPPLVLDAELNRVALEWTKKIAAKQKMEHSDTHLGENVYWSSNDTVSGTTPVEAWYREIKDFDYKKMQPQKGTGHFTQVIWKGTKKFGIARVTCSQGTTYVVANYDPAGNFVGQYAENILKAK